MEKNRTSKAVVPYVLVLVVMCLGSYYLGMRHGAAESGDSVSLPQASFEGENPEVSSSETAEASRVNEAVADSQASEPMQARQDIESEQRQRLMRNIEANLEMPGMSRIIRDQQRVLMADQFGSLIDTLGLNDEEQEYFLDLLTTRQMYQVDMGMKLMTGMLSVEERNELMKRVGAGIDQIDEEIDWFLNNETDSEYFEYYERTEGERTLVEAVSDQLSQAGHPLEEGMDMELIALMHEEISDYPFSVEFEENGEPVFANFTSANIDTFVHEMQQLREPMMQQAAEVLDTQQLNIFADSFDQYVAFYDQRLRMVQQLFNPAH